MDYCCPPPKVPKIKVLLDCGKKELCDPLQQLIRDWSITYTFASTSDVAPKTFQAQGLYSSCHSKIDSVAQKYLPELSHPPTSYDLDGSTIQLPIPGLKGSTCSRYDGILDKKDFVCCDGYVEMYFLGQGDDLGKYRAILEAQIPETGTEMLCRLKDLFSEADPDRPVDLIFVAVLRYIEAPVYKPITNTFEMPPDLDEAD